MKREILDLDTHNTDAAWERFQKRSSWEVVTLIPAMEGGRAAVEDNVLLRGENNNETLSWVVWLKKEGKGTLLILELYAKSNAYDGQRVRITLPTATTPEGMEACKELGVVWANDPPVNILSDDDLVKGIGMPTRLGMLKMPISNSVRNQLVNLLQPIELEKDEEDFQASKIGIDNVGRKQPTPPRRATPD